MDIKEAFNGGSSYDVVNRLATAPALVKKCKVIVIYINHVFVRFNQMMIVSGRAVSEGN